MTRKEKTGTRDLTFNGWVRNSLPDSNTGFIVSDIDFYMYNWKKMTHLMVEIKTRNSPLAKWQEIMYNNLSKWIKEGSKKEGWDFKGFFFIKFENSFFNDGKVYLNEKESSEEEIIKVLSL